jgi:glyceraldehyde-3-phosphate dehydrogenase (NAD(P))
MSNIVHVVGTGTIGEPLIEILSTLKQRLRIDEVTFAKSTPRLTERPKVLSLIREGAIFAADKSKWPEFRKLGMEPTYDYEEAIARASVVIDCTPEGTGLENKQKFYQKYVSDVTGFLAQGSEFGFGRPYAYGINDHVMKPTDKYVQVVSCNTHNIAVMLKTLTFDQNSTFLKEGKFLCIRRSSDIGDRDDMVPSPKVSNHEEPWGTHHARDAYYLFETLGVKTNLFSSAMKMNSQYMHCIWFDLLLGKTVTIEEVADRIAKNPRVSITYKDMSSLVFSFGRDHGRFGRILNQAVVVLPSLHVRNGNEIVGFCFTPADGNSLLSSIAAAERFLNSDHFDDVMGTMDAMLFKEV